MVTLLVGLLMGGLLAGIALAGMCSENLHPGTDRTRVCNGIDAGAFWLLVLVPPALLLLSQFIGRLRRKPLLVTLVIAVPVAAIWTYLLLVANGDLGDTNIG